MNFAQTTHDRTEKKYNSFGAWEILCCGAIRQHSDVPLVTSPIVSLGQILLQEPNRLLCGAPGLLVPGRTNGS